MPLDMDKEELNISMAEFINQMNVALDNGKIVGRIAERDLIIDWLEEVSSHPSKPSIKWIIDRLRNGIDG
jgi:hypothetical protein